MFSGKLLVTVPGDLMFSGKLLVTVPGDLMFSGKLLVTVPGDLMFSGKLLVTWPILVPYQVDYKHQLGQQYLVPYTFSTWD